MSCCFGCKDDEVIWWRSDVVQNDMCLICIDCLDGMEFLIFCGMVVKYGMYLYCVVCKEGIFFDIYDKG